MIKRLRESLARRLGRRPADGYDDGRVIDTPPAARLIDELGLLVDDRPVRERPGWSPPRTVLVMGASPARLEWFRAAAPGLRILGESDEAGGLRAVADAEALIGWCTPAIVERGARLRWIQVQRAGAEQLTVQSDVASGRILLTSLRGLAAPVVADHAFALLLALTRRLPELGRHQQQHRWAQAAVDASRLSTLHGRTLLVAGLGGIGMAVARRARGFGMRVLAVRAGRPTADGAPVDHVGRSADLHRLAAEADVIVNALPLTDATRGVFNAALFDVLRPGALFVNVGRGGAVDTGDLTRALERGQLAGAALDVTDPQPLPTSHPLWRLPNVILTPHVASWSGTTAAWGWTIARENLRRYVAGEPMVSVVDVARGY